MAQCMLLDKEKDILGSLDVGQGDSDSEQDNNTSLHKKCAICVHQDLEAIEDLPPELTELIHIWPDLPTHIKQSIKELIKKPKTNRVSRH